MQLRNKRILFFTVDFFNYQEEICRVLRERGFIVDYFDERPANTFWVKVLIRINRFFLAIYINNYHNKIIEKTKANNYDYLFLINNEALSGACIEKMKKNNPGIKVILYLWDSLENNKNALKNIKHFDRVQSFDKKDCEKYYFSFLPLFYVKDYACIAKEKCVQDIDLLFIGTVHSDRFSFLKMIKQQFKDYRVYYYLLFKSVILYYKNRIFDISFIGTQRTDFKYKALSKSEIIELYKRTKIVLDIQHPKQTGLTMRTFEVLGAKRKLITTNVGIKEYDFYNENNICVVDRKAVRIPESFLNLPYKDISLEIYERYSINSWIDNIFSS